MNSEEEKIKKLNELIKITSDLTNKTNILISLFFRETENAKLNVKEQVEIFKNMGMEDYKEISKIIGQNPKSVSSALTHLKKKK